MPANQFQKTILGHLKRIIGCSPKYYDIAAKSKTQRLKWFGWKAPGNLSNDVVKYLQESSQGRLDIKLMDGAPWVGRYLNVWVPEKEDLPLIGLLASTKPYQKLRLGEIPSPKAVAFGDRFRKQARLRNQLEKAVRKVIAQAKYKDLDHDGVRKVLYDLAYIWYK